MDKETFVISPIGAAIVEAMPDRMQQARIQRRFKRMRICPTSEIFPSVESVEQFYLERNESVKGEMKK